MIPLKQPAIDCKSCEMKFNAPNFYIQHYQTIHGDIPPDYIGKELFICDQCTHVFISKHSLAAHTLTHTRKPKERKCPHCEKEFRCSSSYNEHIRVIHEKNATFKCDECPKSFGYLSKLNSHKQLVHQRVKCEECGQDISNLHMLKKHPRF